MAPVLLAAMLSLTACGGGDEAAAGISTSSATLSWLPPTENVDGTSVSELAGYRIYAGQSHASLSVVRTISNPGITTSVIDGLAAGTHYFSVSAFTSSGAESDASSIGSKTVR
jgi:hypothetical protein